MVWVTGSNGMLGREIVLALEGKGVPFIATDREVDITSGDTVRNFLSDNRVQWIVNCAAYTAVDKAEDDEETAFRLNSEAVLNLVNGALISNSRIIHFSTDYVFKGDKETGYSENDPTAPQGVYGFSKLSGENNLRENYSNYFIFRISWLYGLYGKNFVSTMLNLFEQKDELNVVDDQFGSPTSAAELAIFISEIIQDGSDKYGIYHFSGEGETCWYEFAKEIYRLSNKLGLINRDVHINPVDSSRYPVKAKRPAFSYMIKDKLFNTFGYRPKKWQDTLEEYIVSLSG